MSFDYSYNGTNLGDPRDTPEEKEIARLTKFLGQTRNQLVLVTAERDAMKPKAARYDHFLDNCTPTLLLSREIKCSITFSGEAWISDGTPELFKKSVDACFDAAIEDSKNEQV